MKRNKGFSLIELVVTIAIMAVLTGIISMSISVIFGLEARECANDINGYIKQTKTNALSKDGQILNIYKDAADNEYYVEFFVMQWKKDALGAPHLVKVSTSKEHIASESVSISYKLAGDTTEYAVDTSNTIGISFNRSSGAFEEVYINNVKQSGKNCERIIIKKGLKVYEIIMIPETGKHYL